MVGTLSNPPVTLPRIAPPFHSNGTDGAATFAFVSCCSKSNRPSSARPSESAATSPACILFAEPGLASRCSLRHTPCMSFLRLLALVLAVVLSSSLLAKDVPVRGYTRKDGTYVAPHVRTAPNSTKSDNYSTKDNINPYTGKAGTKPGDAATERSSKTSTAVPSTTPPAKPESTNVTATPVTAVSPTPNLALVTIGMTKAQVVTALGKPNVESAKSWFYTNGGWVRFKDDKVSNIEAR